MFTDSTPPSTSSQSAAAAALVRRRDVGAEKAERDEPADRVLEPLRADAERDVGDVERERREGGVLHPRRERVHLGIPQQPDETCRAADHAQPQPKPYSQALAKNSDSLAVKKWCTLSGLRTKKR